MSNTAKAWVVRGSGADGKHGMEYATHVRDFVKINKVAVIGWTDKFSDLAQLENEFQLKKLFESRYGTDHQEGPDSGLTQLERFRFEINLNDLVVMPWKSKMAKPADMFSLGVVARGYYFEDSVVEGLDQEMCHRIGVEWHNTDFPREVFDKNKDLYRSLSRPPNVFPIGKKEKNASYARRLQVILETGSDPGPQWDSIRGQTQGGISYREPSRQETVNRHEVWEVDPDLRDRGTATHMDVQGQLADAVRFVGMEPRSPAPHDPQFDVAWQIGDSAFVVEVKSLTEENEEQQLRLGLGQVLCYAFLLDWPKANNVQPVLAVERPPTGEYWIKICKEHGVILTWSGVFEDLFD